MLSEFRYRAFISYSHQDERWARWLHRALERYRVPRRLVGAATPAGPVPRHIAPVFRDRDELPSATDLGRVVGSALEQSAALIVICSPAAARSRWVNEEIRTFRRLGRTDRIFCLIVDGEPGRGADGECFPEALRGGAAGRAEKPVGDAERGGVEVPEPAGADLRPGKDGRRQALLKLVAGLLGVGLDELVRRELQRRHRRLLAVTAAAVAGMGVASLLAALALVSRNEAQRQRARAEVEATTAEQTSEFLVQLFQVADPGEARGNSISAREILDRGAARIDKELTDQPVVRANLMQTMGRVYTGLGLYEPAASLLRRALAQREELDGQPTRDTVAMANALGSALYLKGEYDAAQSIYDRALTAARSLFPRGDPLLTEAMNGVADLQTQRGEFQAAEAEYSAALAIDRRLHGEMHADVARTLAGLATASLYDRKFAQSEAAFREALAIRRKTLGDDHPLVAETLNNLGSMLYFAGKPDDAEPFFEEAAERYQKILGDEHPEVASTLNNLGRILVERGKLAEAQVKLDRALAIARKLKDPDHDDFVYILNNDALARLGLGEVDSAVPLLEEAQKIAEEHHHRMLGQVWANLGEAYWRSGRAADALKAIDKARPLLRADQPDDAWPEANLKSIEGAVRVGQKELDVAGPLLLDSYPIIEGKWGRRGVYTRLAANRVAAFYKARGNDDLAAQYLSVAAAD